METKACGISTIGDDSCACSTTCFDRAAEMRPCPIGSSGACCSTCSLGPCRLTTEKTGVCGATLATVAARNLTKAIAVGAAAHADHGRDIAEMLLAYSEGALAELSIADISKLQRMARLLGIDASILEEKALAGEVADAVLDEYGRQRGELSLLNIAPEKRRALWKALGLSPRGIDREIVETLHRTHAGTDQDSEHLLDQAMRTALADGWGGSMFATELTDAVFGTPKATLGETGLGTLDAGAVNIVVHGHEPIVAEMLALAVADPDLVQKAKEVGASGINLSGLCCTANEMLARKGIPAIGGMTQQEAALLTGLVDVMVVDVQCIFESLASIAKSTGTLLLTTSPKAKITGVRHFELGEDPAQTAKEIVRLAIENFHKKDMHADQEKSELVGGFSLEYIESMLAGQFMRSLRPLNDAIVAGYIRGIAAVVGCDSPHVADGEFSIVHELIRNNVLVVQTGCAALDSARRGFMRNEEDTVESAGPLLKEICRHIGIPPVLHMGSCVDNSRILATLSRMVAVGGLGDDISDLPVVGLAPKWVTEKALTIGTYFAASGVPVIFGHRSPVSSSQPITDLMNEGWLAKLGGSLEFITDPILQAKRAVEVIDERRERLRITGFGLSSDERLGDKERKRQLIWWQKRLSFLLS